jgi:hypothetical protein
VPKAQRTTTVPIMAMLNPAREAAKRVMHREGNVEKAVRVSKANLKSRP